MIIDAFNRFSDAQAVTVTAVSTNVVDLGLGDKGIGERAFRLRIDAVEAALAAGAATVTFDLQTDDNEAFSSPTVVFSSGAIGKAALGLGARAVDAPVPMGLQRYVRINYTVATGPLTAGKFSAALVLDTPANVAYADARNF